MGFASTHDDYYGLQKEFDIEFLREELIDVENVADLVALGEEKTNK